MSYARECAGERAADVEWHALIQVVVPSDNREGFTYYTVHGPFMTAFAPVIQRLRART